MGMGWPEQGLLCEWLWYLRFDWVQTFTTLFVVITTPELLCILSVILKKHRKQFSFSIPFPIVQETVISSPMYW